jgi:hypothetical protein
MRQLLAVNERPDNPIVDLEPAIGQLGDQAAQREVSTLAAFHQPLAIATDDLPGPVTAHA